MRFFDRLSNGWQLGLTSLRIIRENMHLLLFPVISTSALILIALTFFGGFYALFGADPENWLGEASGGNEILVYSALFVYYLINYFLILFFNVGLVHCARLIFQGQEASVREGLQYSSSRTVTILSWAALASTVGVILKIIEDRLGTIGQVVAGLIGIVWSIATFFVVPVIAYEDVGPIEALKRSGKIMKEKWGEAIGANFSFGLFFILGYLVIIVTAILLFQIHPLLAVFAAVLSALLLHTVVAAAKSVFLAAAYNHISQKPAGQFDEAGLLDNLFVPKKK